MKLNAGLVALLAWFALGICTGALPARADTVVLVQGYQASPAVWRASGIGAALSRAGWRDGGHLSLTPGGVVLVPPPAAAAPPHDRRFVTVDLPAEAPLGLQANMLAHYIAFVHGRDAGARVTLVGHSAGGVAARLAMVAYPNLKVDALVTLASPHMGSQLAGLASAVSQSPLSWMAPMVGLGTLNRSSALYRDLAPESPDNLLGWLNRQRHPAAIYVSIVRVKDAGRPDLGDDVVLGFAQDLNSVPALAGGAKSYFSPGEHALRGDDGILIANILAATWAGRAAAH